MWGTHVEVIVCCLSKFSLSTMWVRGIVLGLSVWQQEPCSIKTKYVRHTCKRWWYHLMTSVHKTHSYVLMQKKDQAKVGLSGACQVLAERLNQGSLEDLNGRVNIYCEKGFIRCCGLCSSTIAIYTGEAETIIAVPYPLLDASAIPIGWGKPLGFLESHPGRPENLGFQCQPRRQQWHRYTYQQTEQANNTFASGLLGIWTASRRCCLPRGRVFPPLLVLPGNAQGCVLLIPDPTRLKSWLTLTLSYLNWTCERLTLFYKQWKYLGHKNHAEWTCSLLSLCPFTQQEAFGIHVVFYPSGLAVSS